MQRFLLDTQILLWWLSDDKKLKKEIRKLIANPENEIHVSAVSGWEISIKRQLGKLTAPAELNHTIEQSGFEHLPITFHHGEIAGNLPNHHRDPFDRMLIAQARLEQLTLISTDEMMPLYNVEIVQV